MKKISFLTLFLVLISHSLQASDVNITAEKKVEWHSQSKQIIAIGDAVASKENMKIRADKLIAHYQDGSQNQKGKIKRVEALGNVKMNSEDTSAFGDSLDYNLQEQKAVLKGTPAKITTPKETITAEDNITYYPQEQKAIATGNVLATSEDNRLKSDIMVAYFNKNNSTQTTELEKVEIFNNILITTPSATVKADKGVYYPKEEKVYLYNNIILEQDGNILKGDKAETNIKTGISTLISTAKNGRVTGVFKEKKKEKSPSTGKQENE